MRLLRFDSIFLLVVLLGLTVHAADISCADIATSFVAQATVDKIAACPQVAKCVETACGNSSGTMLQSTCAAYDRACLTRAAACFALQLTNGSAVTRAGAFCATWMSNATKLLTSSAATQRGACKQVACKALALHGYGSGTSCTASASRSAMSDGDWNASCSAVGSPGSTSTGAYIVLPIAMHILGLLVLLFFVVYAANGNEDGLVLFLPLLVIVLFFALIGIAGIVHRQTYGGTVECNAMSVASALQSELGEGATAQRISFFGDCDSSRMEIIGFKGALSAQKCCVPRPPPNTTFKCNGIAIVPNLLDNPLIVTDDVQRGIFARCCPTLDGKTVPVGFAAMTISACIGIVVSVLLNLMSSKLVPLVKKTCWHSFTCFKSKAVAPTPTTPTETVATPTPVPIDDANKVSSVETDVEAKALQAREAREGGITIEAPPQTDADDDEDDEDEAPKDKGKALHQFLGACLQPSGFGLVKLLLSFVLNIIGAAMAAHSASGNSWDQYSVFVSTMVNGPFTANLCDVLCTLLVYSVAEFQNSAKSKDSKTVEAINDVLSEVAAPVLIFFFVVFSPAVVTHWIPGLVVFLPMLFIYAMLAMFLFVFVLLPVQTFASSITEDDDERPWYLFVLFTIGVFATCLVVNMSLLQAARFPVNWAMLLYGDAAYPYFTARPGASTTEQLAEFYGAMFNMPFYFMQMSSQSCQLLKSADSAMTQINTVMMYV